MSKSIFWLIVLLVGAGIIISANFFRDKPKSFLNTPLNTPIPTPQQSPLVNEVTPNQTNSETNLPISKPATCQLMGKISFLSPNLYKTEGAKIVYQNVDDVIRQIFWTVSPDDGSLSVGPNLFEQLKIPDGEREVGVSLDKTPSSNIYTLTAQITYGVKFADGKEEVRKAKCDGKIIVDASKAK